MFIKRLPVPRVEGGQMHSWASMLVIATAFPPLLHTLITVISDEAMLTLLPCQCKQDKPSRIRITCLSDTTGETRVPSPPQQAHLWILCFHFFRDGHFYISVVVGRLAPPLRFARGHNHTGWFPDGTSDLLHADVGAAVRSICEDASVWEEHVKHMDVSPKVNLHK